MQSWKFPDLDISRSGKFHTWTFLLPHKAGWSFQVSHFLGFHVSGILGFQYTGFLTFWISDFAGFWVSDAVASDLSFGFWTFWICSLLSFWYSRFLVFWISDFLFFWFSTFVTFQGKTISVSEFPGFWPSRLPGIYIWCSRFPMFQVSNFLSFWLSGLHFPGFDFQGYQVLGFAGCQVTDSERQTFHKNFSKSLKVVCCVVSKECPCQLP